MKSKKSHYLLLVLMAAALFTTSCRKEGCIVPIADNYDPKATDLDNSCIFSAQHIIYYNYNVAQALLSNGINEIIVKTSTAHNTIVHASASWSSTPSTYNSNCIVLNANSMRTTVQNDYVTITDVYGNVLWQFNILFDATKETSTELLASKAEPTALTAK